MDTAAAECERQADGQREETEGDVGDMKICEGAKQNLWKMQERLVFQCVALDDLYEIGMSEDVKYGYYLTLTRLMSQHTQKHSRTLHH